jgi:hypothetical protein
VQWLSRIVDITGRLHVVVVGDWLTDSRRPG